MVQISIDGTLILFTIRVTTYEALLQAIVRHMKTNRILPIFYLDKLNSTYFRLEHDDLEPLRRQTHMKLRLSGTDVVPYEGELNSDGKKYGHGMYRWANGRTYVGEWIDGKKHERSIKIFPNGDRFNGMFANDKALESTTD